MKRVLPFGGPWRNALVESYKTPPSLPVKFACLTNPYIIANPTPWTDCINADTLLSELAQATEGENNAD